MACSFGFNLRKPVSYDAYTVFDDALKAARIPVQTAKSVCDARIGGSAYTEEMRLYTPRRRCLGRDCTDRPFTHRKGHSDRIECRGQPAGHEIALFL